MSDKQWWTSSSGLIEFEVTLDDARSCSHSGRCDDDVAALRRTPYIAEQLAKIAPEDLAAELKGYGAWDAAELADHEANLSRVLWLACCAICEEAPCG